MQWQVSTDGGNTFSNVAGATSNTLTIDATANENGNRYRAVFTNSAGSATTASATLTVSTQPSSLVIDSSASGLLGVPFSEPSYPGGGVYFASQVVRLSNGNIVATDIGGAGAVFLYDGQTGALISSLFGASWIAPLTNGNFVAYTPAAATP